MIDTVHKPESIHVEHVTSDDALPTRSQRLSRAGSRGGRSVPAEKRSFFTNRDLAAAAGSKGGKSVPAAKRPFARNPESARNAALRRHELARAAKERVRYADALAESRGEQHETNESHFGVSSLFRNSHR